MNYGAPPVSRLEPRQDFHPLAAAAGHDYFQNLAADPLRASADLSHVENIGVSGEAQEELTRQATAMKLFRCAFPMCL